MSNLKITTVQSDIIWEDKKSNLDFLDKHLFCGSDIIVLPEMFTTGFSMNTQLSESMQGETIGWMSQKSKNLNSVICGSLIIHESNYHYNRFIWVEPNGDIKFYDKRHLFSYAQEDKFYQPGQQTKLIEYKEWKILPLICYDLRFPVWSRNVDNYDLLLYIANWPKTRSFAWRTLLQARAIENQSYVIGVNRVGEDGSGKSYSGNSMLVDFSGEILFETENQISIQTLVLEKQPLIDFRKEFPFLKDKDKFEII